MSNIEHLLENAISEIEHGKGIEDFVSRWYNTQMLNSVNATADEIWQMAQYVVFSYKG